MLAVVVLSLLLAALPATAWADHGDRGRSDDGRGGPSSSDRRGDRGESTNQHRGKDAWRDAWGGAWDDSHRKDVRGPARPRAQGQDHSGAGKGDGGFVTAASVQPTRSVDNDRRAEQRARDQAERARQQAARERQRAQAERERQESRARAERDRQEAARDRAARASRVELDRVAPDPAPAPAPDPGALPAPGPAPAPRVTPDEAPQQDEPEVVTGVPASPSPTALASVAPTSFTAAPEPQTAAAATPPVDVLAHEQGVVDRTVRAGGTLLRDTGRAVVAAIPPQARSFSIPLGLLVALGGYLVVQRRFRPGVLPMSAAAVPQQEGARERHRL